LTFGAYLTNQWLPGLYDRLLHPAEGRGLHPKTVRAFCAERGRTSPVMGGRWTQGRTGDMQWPRA
jgi:hypothetical protein